VWRDQDLRACARHDTDDLSEKLGQGSEEILKRKDLQWRTNHLYVCVCVCVCVSRVVVADVG